MSPLSTKHYLKSTIHSKRFSTLCFSWYTFGSDIWQWKRKFQYTAVYTNHDYEPYAIKRNPLSQAFKSKNISFLNLKDQVIFEKAEVVKADGIPYTHLHSVFRLKEKYATNQKVRYPVKTFQIFTIPNQFISIPQTSRFRIRDLGSSTYHTW